MDLLAPRDENARLAALAACAIMDTPRESPFDSIVYTIAQIFRAPMAALSLVEADRVWVKASVGPLPTEWQRSTSFCGHLIASGQMMVVEDAASDPRYAALPCVAGEPKIRFVAGTPLRGPGGHHIGALCVFDRLPRTIADRQRLQLKQVAAEASELLRLRIPNLDLDMVG